MERIVFINQDSGYLMIDIINAYARAGYSCTLIAGRLVVRNNPLDPSIFVDKIIRYNRVTTFKRLSTWIIGFIQIWFKVVFKYRKDTLFIVSNPPLAPLLPVMVKNNFSLLIFDIFPDVLSELGYLPEQSVIIKGWRKLNRKIYKKAERIYTITEGMKQVLQKYAGERSIEVVSLWTDNGFLKPVDRESNPFIRKHGLTNKFVVLYSGNLGLSGDVNVMIEVARVIENDDVLFLIIGEGARKKDMQERVRSLNLGNIMFLPWQPVEELTFSFSSANIAVVSLGKGASKLAIPSKLCNYLSVGAPLLCISSKGSEVENLVNSFNCGRNFEPAETDKMARFIKKTADDKSMQNQMRENSLKASAFFSSENVLKFLPECS